MSRKGAILLALVVLMVNLPYLQILYVDWKIDRSGTEVAATLTRSRSVGPADDLQYYIEFTFPRDIDKGQVLRTQRVTAEAYRTARETGVVQVRVLADQPARFDVAGKVRGHLALVLTLVADAFLLALVLLLGRFRGRSRPELVLVAIEELEPCPPGSVLDRIHGELYVVCGEVAEAGDDELVLDLGDRRVRVVLDGHVNPVGPLESVKVTGRMVG